MTVISKHLRGVTLNVIVQPRASRNEIVGEQDGALKVRLAAPPVDDAANAELIALLARRLGVRKRDVEILSGARSRRKVVLIIGLGEQDAATRLR
jgi:hypothetical protein